jgi:putative transposase
LATLFLDLLKADREKERYKVHEMVLMPDHFHAMLTPAFEVSLEKAVQSIKGGFSYRAKKETGTNIEIWQSGYNSHNIQNADDYQTHRDYIYQNPVRAGLCREPQEYRYSSANAAMKALMDEVPPWLKPQVKAANSLA